MDDHLGPIAAPQARGQVALTEGLLGTITVARALVLGGRTVDLSGLNDQVGALTALLLDMPWDESRRLLPQLHDMVAELDRLAAAIRRAGGAGT
jgi:hypothetical protein